MRRFKFIDARIVLFQAIEKDVSRVRISMKEIVDENLFNEVFDQCVCDVCALFFLMLSPSILELTRIF